jgi:hypothetical protein
MRPSLLFGSVFLAFAALIAVIPSPTTADEADSVEIKKRINWWRKTAPPKYTDGIDFTSIDLPSPVVPSIGGRGVAINIGVNRTNSDQFTADELQGCINDLEAMAGILKNFELYKLPGETKVGLRDEKATHDAILGAISRFAASGADPLKAGDILVITFSGHGAFINVNQGTGEPADFHSAWCANDLFVAGNELRSLWPQFNAGVRILVISDSCASGSVTKSVEIKMINAMVKRNLHTRAALEKSFAAHNDPKVVTKKFTPVRGLTIEHASASVAKQQTKLRAIQSKLKTLPGFETDFSDIKASVLLFGACKEKEETGDTPTNGYYTSVLLGVWNNGSFSGNYRNFYDAIDKLVESETGNTPSYLWTPTTPNPAFEGQKPFSK